MKPTLSDIELSRLGKKCHACGCELRRCVVCSKEFPAPRSDATTCSLACRARKKYRKDKGAPIRDDRQEEWRALPDYIKPGRPRKEEAR